jgi:acyl-CoA dehydrogenase
VNQVQAFGHLMATAAPRG